MDFAVRITMRESGCTHISGTSSIVDYPYWEYQPSAELAEKGFQVRDRLGWGRFAAVYRASHPDMPEDVAIKIFRHGGDFFEAYQSEAKLLPMLKEAPPQVLRAFDAFEFKDDESRVFGCIVYELYEESLADLLAGNENSHTESDDSEEDENHAKESFRHRCTLEETRRVVGDVSRGLAFLHERGYVHTDIKPENILVRCNTSEDGTRSIEQACVCDFGSVLHLGPDAQSIEFHVGTMAYNAPEVVLGVPYDTPSDLWSLACTAYEMLTGELLFDPEVVFDKDSEDEESEIDDDETEIEPSSSSDDDTYSSCSGSDETDVSEGVELSSRKAYDWLLYMTMVQLWEKMLGKLPRKMRLGEDAHRAHWYFDEMGRIPYRMRYLDSPALDALDSLSMEERIFLEVLLKPCLAYDGTQRPTAAQLANLAKNYLRSSS
jgi:serine/threonine protein kinase